MALFTKRDLTAIAFLVILIVSGWCVRYYLERNTGKSEVIVHQEVIPVPETMIPVISGGKDSIVESKESKILKPININTARQNELESLPFIGPSKAAEILKYREKNGNFKSASDIIKVKGIGKSTYEKIKEYITVK